MILIMIIVTYNDTDFWYICWYLGFDGFNECSPTIIAQTLYLQQQQQQLTIDDDISLSPSPSNDNAIATITNIPTYMSLLHGDDDIVVPPSSSLEFMDGMLSLSTNHYEVHYHIYQNDCSNTHYRHDHHDTHHHLYHHSYPLCHIQHHCLFIIIINFYYYYNNYIFFIITTTTTITALQRLNIKGHYLSVPFSHIGNSIYASWSVFACLNDDNSFDTLRWAFKRR